MQAQNISGDRGEHTRKRTTSDALPAPNTRWTPLRKSQVVAALHRGELTFLDACQRYGLSPEELASWEQSYSWGGTHGLTWAGIKERRMAVHAPGRA